jgi:hypothetical protein
MFRDVPVGNEDTEYAHAADFLEPGRYVVKLIRHEDLGISAFAKPEDKNPAHRIAWVFQVGTDTGQPMVAPDGRALEFKGYTNNATGPRSSARPWIEALLNREIIPGESGAALAQEVIGKKALAMLNVVSAEDAAFPDRKNVKVLDMSPFVPRGNAASSAPAPRMPQSTAVAAAGPAARQPVAARAPAPRQQQTTAVTDPDLDDLPF